jgi:hypothetical protein
MQQDEHAGGCTVSIVKMFSRDPPQSATEKSAKSALLFRYAFPQAVERFIFVSGKVAVAALA